MFQNLKAPVCPYGTASGKSHNMKFYLMDKTILICLFWEENNRFIECPIRSIRLGSNKSTACSPQNY